jgi:hypothetical protein
MLEMLAVEALNQTVRYFLLARESRIELHHLGDGPLVFALQPLGFLLGG